MLQEQYEKNNLEIPFDENTRLFQVKFMEKNYTVSHPGLEIRCLDEAGSRAVLCSDIHAKILLLRYFTEGDYMKATGNLLSYRDLPWGEVYYRQFYGRCVMRLARMFGKQPEAFQKAMFRFMVG